MRNANRKDVPASPSQTVRELNDRELQSVEGGRHVDDGCYLYYGYYCPSNELKPFGK